MLITILLLQCISSQIIRHDLNIDKFTFNLQTAYNSFQVAVKPIQSNLEKLITISSSKFNFDYSCAVANSNICANAKQDIISVSEKISKLIFIKEEIKVFVSFSSLNSTNNPGKAVSASFFVAQPVDGTAEEQDRNLYSYPQALIKNLNLDVETEFAEFDIIATFNSDFNFWFSNDTNIFPISPNQTSFEMFVAKEFTSALGFSSNWVKVSKDINTLTPPLQVDELNPNFYSKWSYNSIFDKFLFKENQKESLMEISNSIRNNFHVDSLSQESFFSWWPKSASYSNASKLYNDIKLYNNSIYLRSSNDPNNLVQLSIDTNELVNLEFSLSFLDDTKYLNSEEFLMTRTLPTGKSLVDFLNKSSTVDNSSRIESIWGPNISQVMLNIGWASPLDQKIKNAKINFLVKDESSSGNAIKKKGMTTMEIENLNTENSTAPKFAALKPSELQDNPQSFRRITIPLHRLTPLKKDWMKLYTPLVENMKLQVRMNLKAKCVELRNSEETADSGAVQKGADFIKAYALGFEIQDAIALLRLDDLYLDSFETKDIKTLHGDNLSRAIGRIVGKEGKTKFTIENTSRTRIVVADTKIHIMGSFQNIKIARDALISLIMGASPGKVYSKLRTISSRMKERF